MRGAAINQGNAVLISLFFFSPFFRFYKIKYFGSFVLFFFFKVTTNYFATEDSFKEIKVWYNKGLAW